MFARLIAKGIVLNAKRPGPALCAALAAGLSLAIGVAAPAHARFPFSHAKPAAADPAVAEAVARDIDRALQERRLADAGALLEQAAGAGMKTPRITELTGELLLARARYADALDTFHKVEADEALRARVMQGEGIALSLMGRSDDALAALTRSTSQDPSLWRAWNALGKEYDLRRDWVHADQAYTAALGAPSANAAVVLNNRGYSRLLQGKKDEASQDFVAALEKDPSLAAARTNLRLALALKGDYARAAAAGVGEDRAVVLNNVGLAAALRGDFAESENLLGQAMAARGQYYGRASSNLELAHSLELKANPRAEEPHDGH